MESFVLEYSGFWNVRVYETSLKVVGANFRVIEDSSRRTIMEMKGLDANSSKMRDQLSVIVEILEITRKETSKTRIQSDANLCFKQANEYIKFLSEVNLLERSIQGNRAVFKVTDKGQDFLRRSYELKELIEADGDEKGIRRPPMQLLRNSW